MPHNHEMRIMNDLKNKWGIPHGKLSVERGERLPKLTKDQPVDKHYKDYVDGLKHKFGINQLEIEGMETRKETTLADIVNESERAESKDMKLCVASTDYKGKPVKLWFLKSKA